MAAAVFVMIAGCAAPDGCGRSRPAPPRRLIIMVIDTLRADHVHAYGYERETTPWIDLAASRGVLFERVVASSSWTQPSMASLFTSTYPSWIT